MDLNGVLPGKFVINNDMMPLFVPVCQLWNDIVTHFIDPWCRAALQPERRFLQGVTIMYCACWLGWFFIVATGPLWLWVVWGLFLVGWALCLVDLSQRTLRYGTFVAAILSYYAPIREFLSRPLPDNMTVRELFASRVRRNDLAYHFSRLALLAKMEFSREEATVLLEGCTPAFVNVLTSTPEDLRNQLLEATTVTRAGKQRGVMPKRRILPPLPVDETPIPEVTKPEIPMEQPIAPARHDCFGRPELTSVLQSIAVRRITLGSFAKFLLSIIKNSDLVAGAALFVAAISRRSRKNGMMCLLALFTALMRRRITRMIAK